MIPCVILASTLRSGVAQADLDAFSHEYYDFVPGQLRVQPLELVLHDKDDQDGGNGSGAEAGGGGMHPAIGSRGKAFWDFQTHPDDPNRDVAFPPDLRFELCLYFQDIGQAAAFLKSHSAGQRLGRLFTYVQIVSLSAAAFLPPGSGMGA